MVANVMGNDSFDAEGASLTREYPAGSFIRWNMKYIMAMISTTNAQMVVLISLVSLLRFATSSCACSNWCNRLCSDPDSPLVVVAAATSPCTFFNSFWATLAAPVCCSS
ncbi:hypothetical protein D3C81_1542650 [compost metagenome]